VTNSVTVGVSTPVNMAGAPEGIAKAKAAGVYRGRPASIDADRVRQLKSDGKGATEIARAMGVGRASGYRLLAAA
jgi:DNA invertase Pin-like site-specific DNA recombinase